MTAPVVLVVDDDRVFRWDVPNVYARTWKRGQKLIRKQAWDEVWLDHDLGFIPKRHRRHHDESHPTIRPLVLWLAEQAFNGAPLPIGTIYVHTMNPVGAEWMVSTLRPYYRVRRVYPPELWGQALATAARTPVQEER